ncbi:hypothetical protein T459_29093 [Capsicum annuum]|uniref:Pollen Ole e 1 allergen and extensin family protein n=1 Tax=Capsicum annuum TaxID=4072 RepID=A0A1U8F733_CAPAN|nr:uncharacterized protein LOC107851495 [Capsicum annuum]PHT64668.1 hypothetical protein T459_29093 [Capsicum annuum]
MYFFFMNKIVKRKMSNMNFIFFFFSFFIVETLGVSILESIIMRDDMIKMAGYGEEKLSNVFIYGKVVCHEENYHDCNNIVKDDNNFELGSRPMSGASIGVFCGSSGKTRRSWARNTTDEDGEFLIDLPSHLHAIPNLEKTCCVKVLHLPRDTICRHAFRGQHKGLELASIGEGIRTYTTQTIHLTPKAATRPCGKKVVVM